ncbi:MAG: hypothetical protein K9N55_05425 [Phycisphaerae bacterium]|nr:hypothetical protein [Phycisphaerae bacterium]
MHNNALILAGGANFPDGLPWTTRPDGSSPRKMYNREIYVLQKDSAWALSDVTLPKGYSYGVSIPLKEGLLCIGGEWCEYDAQGAHMTKSDRVFMIRHVGRG